MLLYAAIIGSALLLGGAWLWRAARVHQRARTLREDILKRFYQRERQGHEVQLEALAGMLSTSIARVRTQLDRLIDSGLVADDGTALQLTERGRHHASQLVRGHRLLETYLSDRTGHPLDRLHQLADRREHRLEEARIEELDRLLGYPLRDPHGDPIPGAVDHINGPTTLPLRLFPAGSAVRVVHVEDEPPTLYRELLAAGIVRGTELEVLNNETSGMDVLVAGRAGQRLGPLAGAQVDVVPSDSDAATLRGLVPLSDIPLGRQARIVMLTGLLRGEERRRLLDLGFTPNTAVRPALNNALGKDPRAYLIRHSKIALRSEQARHILVVPDDDGQRTEVGA